MNTLRTDTNTGVAQSTASRCLRQFTRALNKRAEEIIRFPVSDNDVTATLQDFRAIAGTLISNFDIKIVYKSECYKVQINLRFTLRGRSLGLYTHRNNGTK